MDPIYLVPRLHCNLIVVAQCGTKDDAGSTFKTVYPFLEFSLAADLKEVYPIPDEQSASQNPPRDRLTIVMEY